MTDSILSRYTNRRPEDIVESLPLDAEGTDDFGSFGWLRGVRDRAVMLELRLKNGNIIALGYSWLDRAECNPSQGITLHFGNQTITVTGRNLNAETRPNVRLFDGLIRHRVPWIQEAGLATVLHAQAGATIVDAIALK